MPTYQYTCTECGEPLEVVQSFTDPPLTLCPACGGKLRKVFSAVGVVFKGSGFYKTDSRAAPKKAAASESKAPAGKESGATATPSGSADGAADKAPAEKKPGKASGGGDSKVA